MGTPPQSRRSWVTVTDDVVRGTSAPVSGDFRLEFDGELTGYMSSDALQELIKAFIDSVGDAARSGPDVNRC